MQTSNSLLGSFAILLAAESMPDLYEGLGLLDFLSFVDAHLDLYSRKLRKRTGELKQSADRLAQEADISTEKVKQRLKVIAKETWERDGIILDQARREKLERKLKDTRELMRNELRGLSEKLKEEKTVRLRDKLSFFLGVSNIVCCCLLLGFAPQWVPTFYSLQVAIALPYRIYTYYAKAYHYFLFDLCYAVNGLVLIYLWILPSSPALFTACYGLSLGSLGTAIALWRNSLVFHSLDKMISLAIHILPMLVMTTIKHFYPIDIAELRYPALKELKTLHVWNALAINMIVYLIWQTTYYTFVIVGRKQRIKEGRATSFTYLINDKKRLIGQLAAKVKPEWREFVFMFGQAIYTFITLLLPILVLFDSKFWSSVYLLILFAVSAWNGASFYFDVFARKFEKELLALRIQFDETQLALQRSQSQSSLLLLEAESRSAPMSKASSFDEIEADSADEMDQGFEEAPTGTHED